MPRTWFTADTHFGHANIIKYCNRPFKDVDEMDRELVRRWNETVAPDDNVWHLGVLLTSLLAHWAGTTATRIRELEARNDRLTKMVLGAPLHSCGEDI